MNKRCKPPRSILILALLATSLMSHGAVQAQRPAQPGAPSVGGCLSPAPGRAIEDVLFPADAVVQHQDALTLTEIQRAMIAASVAALQAASLELRLSMERDQKALRSLLERRPIDIKASAEQMNRLLAAEGQLKSLHFQLLVKIKNTLTDAQVSRLNQILGRC